MLGDMDMERLTVKAREAVTAAVSLANAVFDGSVQPEELEERIERLARDR
jgi:hypothetical protein